MTILGAAALAFALALPLAACSPAPPAPTTASKDARMPGPKPESPESPENPVKPESPGLPVCASLAELAQHEGEVVQVQGKFRFPTELAFARNMLLLDDGTKVVLARPADPAVAAVLVEANQGARMGIRGRIYTKQIPDKYRIIGRTPDPYLVDVDGAELLPAP